MTALLAFLLLVQQQPESLKVLSMLASSLSEGNAAGAVSVLDKNMPGYQKLSDNIFALTSQADLSCSIDPVEQNGDQLEVEWFLLVRSKEENGPTERRQMNVKVTVGKVGKSWKITGLAPASILDPPGV
jgi:hypothetical protein